MKQNNLQIRINIFFAATLITLGQSVQAGALILGGSQTINNDSDVSAIVVGNSGTDTAGGNGYLIVNNGAALTNYDENYPTPPGEINGVKYRYESGYLGLNSGSAGVATVTGRDTLWDNSSGDLYIGYQGQGTLSIEKEGSVLSNEGYVGYESGSYGSVTVTGTDSLWDTVNLYVGGSTSDTAAQGELIINDGGVVSTFENATIWSTGSLSGTEGTLDGNTTNYGQINPGNLDNLTGALTITGDLVLTDTSILVFDIFNPTRYDQLLLGGDFTIDGLLKLNFDGFIQSAVATTYELIYIGGNLTGTEGNFNFNVSSTGFDSSLLSYHIVESNRSDYSQMLRLIVAGVDDSENPIPEPAPILLIGLAGVIMQWQRYRNKRVSN